MFKVGDLVYWNCELNRACYWLRTGSPWAKWECKHSAGSLNRGHLVQTCNGRDISVQTKQGTFTIDYAKKFVLAKPKEFEFGYRKGLDHV